MGNIFYENVGEDEAAKAATGEATATATATGTDNTNLKVRTYIRQTYVRPIVSHL